MGRSSLECAGDRRRVDQHRRGSGALEKRVGRFEADGRQFDLAGAVQHQQQAAANHIAQRAVGLFPLPCLTELLGKSAPADRGFSAISWRMKVISSAVTTRPRYLHSDAICRQCARVRNGTQVFFTNFLLACSGTPCRWSFRVRIAGREQQLRLMRSQRPRRFVPVGHHRKRPLDNRLVASQNPWPSYVRSRMAVPRRVRKINR